MAVDSEIDGRFCEVLDELERRIKSSFVRAFEHDPDFFLENFRELLDDLNAINDARKKLCRAEQSREDH
jgi:hypothetical protein